MQEKSQNTLILSALWLLMFASSSQFFIVIPILSTIGEQLDIAEGLRGTIVTSYAISLGFFALVVGPISDKIGRRKILLWGTGIMTLSLLLHPLAFDYTSMIIVRMLAGMAGGILTGSCVAYVGDRFPKNKRGWANGIIMTGSAVGQIAGIPLGTILADRFGFEAPFLVYCVAMGFAFILIWMYVPQPDVELSKGKLTIPSVLTGYFKMLKNGVYRSVAFGYMLLFLGMSSFVVYFPTWLETLGANGDQIALIFLVGGIAMVIGSPMAGRFSDRRGRKKIIIFSNLFLAVVMLLTTYVITSISVTTFIFFFVVMLGVSGRMAPYQSLVSEVASDNSRGKLMCLSISIGQLGMGLGSALSGPIYAAVGFNGNTMLGAFAVILMALVVWKFIPETNGAVKVESKTVLETAI
ncbi:MAG: MFS transporter [Cyclobacteriaceae bacterium]